MSYKIVALLCLLFINSAYSEKLIVHKDEQQAMDDLMKSLGVEERYISVAKNEQQINEYSSFFNAGKRYFYDGKGSLGFSVITNQKNRVARLKIRYGNIRDISSILKFEDLVILHITLSELQSLKGIHEFKKLIELRIGGNKNLLDFTDIKDLGKLRSIEASNLNDIDTSTITGLPNLDRFICEPCTISHLSPFKSMRNLRIFKSGVKQKDISALYGLKELEILEVGGENLTDISAVNSMPNLKYLKVYDSSVEKIDLDGSTKHLEFIRIVDSPIKKLPEFKLFNSLKDLSIVGTEVEGVDSIHDLPELEKLVLARNLKLKTVKNLKNLPKLKELKAYNGGIDEFTTGALPSLEELTLSKTNLNRLPSLDSYPSLRELDIKETQITSLKGLDVAPNLYRVYADYDVMKDPENEKLLRELRKNRFKWMKDQKKE